MAISRLDDYEVLEVIGQGCYGKVSRVRRKSDGRVFVWKELEYGKMTSKERELLVGEVNILRKLRHPYIVRYHDHLHDREAKVIYVVTEHCEGGDLGKVIAFQKLKGETFEERWVWTILAQLVLALHECHCHRDGPILHRDIKPSNVFLDYNNNAKLGLARTVSVETESDLLAKTICGTPYYMSPEQMRASRYNDRADIWALGCLIYEVCCLSTPFEGSNQQELAANIIRGQCADLPPHYSTALRTVVASMLAVEPSQRPSVQQLANVHEVSLHIRELTLESQQGMLKRREEAVVASERSLSDRLADLTVREEGLREKEYELQVWERNLRTSERTMAGLARRRELALDDRERMLAEREAALSAREEAMSSRHRTPLHSPASLPSGSNGQQRPPLTRTNSIQSTGSTLSLSSTKSIPIAASVPLSTRTPNLPTHREDQRTSVNTSFPGASSYSSGAYGNVPSHSSGSSKYVSGARAAYGKENTPSVFQASVNRMIDQSRLQHEADLYRLYLCARYYREALQGGGVLPAEELSPEKAPSYEDQKEFVQAVVDKQVIQMLEAIHTNYSRLQHAPPDPSEIDMPFVLERRQSSIPGAGEGVFLRGTAIPGTVVCLYPGTVYTPLDYRHMPNYPNIDKDNDYLMARWDSVVIDGKNPDLAIPPPKESRTEFMLAPKGKKESRSAPPQHPYALGHLINHPTPPERPNVSSLPYDYPGFVPEVLRPYIPNRYFKKPNILYDNKSIVRGLVLVASTHIENEELFLNYRFNPARPLPKWYVPLDREADERRWGA